MSEAKGTQSVRAGATVLDGKSPEFRRRIDLSARYEPMHPVQIEGFRKMTVAQKLDMIWDMRETGICLRIAGLRMRHPDWSEEKLELEARRWAMYATT